MLYTIRTHLLDILAADARLLQGGAAYNPNPNEPAWLGVKRPDNGTDVATKGWINLFDESYKWAGEDHRPAVYIGSRAMKATDKLDYPVISGITNRVEFRILLLPLIVAVQAPTEMAAQKQAEQLRANIKQILLGVTIQAGYWYELTVPGQTGGGAALEHSWTSDTGAGSSGGIAQAGQSATLGVAEAMCTIPAQIRYSYNANSPA